METQSAPPWRREAAERGAPRQQKQPKPTVPNKRPADTQEAAWVADEDRFVLQQAKKKAEIRVKGGRARPIDWLAVTLRVIDPTRNPLDEDVEDSEVDLVDPEGVFEGLSDSELDELLRDIEVYIALENNKSNQDFWNTMKIICTDRREASRPSNPSSRGVSSVSADVDRLLGPKSFEELETLEKQIRRKLQSNEPIDVDYWEHLLRSLLVWKAKAKLRKVSQSIINSRLEGLRKQQEQEAMLVRQKLQTILCVSQPLHEQGNDARPNSSPKGPALPDTSPREMLLDPEPLLKLRSEDKSLESLAESNFLDKVVAERRRVVKLGFVPVRQRNIERSSTAIAVRATDSNVSGSSRFAAANNDDFSQATTALYEREVARGVNENEEIFAGEEELTSTSKPQWANKYRPRKPRYFNRVQMGYEWNKYNQTHYDHDNPPPKVVQGYKFNIFYPDLIEKTKAPTYRIERENGRKRGQSFAPAGEEDTCLIRFIAGPPYEDVAFRIVDKEWDYSAKRERGFKSSFDKGILQLHFQFKKIYYRK
ncbi:mid region of cactin-domain-containing protein [Cryomyces antarcticus]